MPQYRQISNFLSELLLFVRMKAIPTAKPDAKLQKGRFRKSEAMVTEMKNIRKAITEKRLYFDGGFGSVLQSMGLAKGTAPELWNLTCPEKVTALHRAYIEAGSHILTTNTFGINRNKYKNYKDMILAAMHCAKQAAQGREDVYIAFDMGPTGRMLEPLGNLPFEEAVALYAANVEVAAKAGADLVIIETMNDAYETKAAVLAVKEHCDLPVFVTNVYDQSGKLMTGADPLSMIALLEGMGVDALGLNCSFGPDKMLEIIDLFTENCSLPLIANPNAGLPQIIGGQTVYTISAEKFADCMVKLAKKGVGILGGCCGTTPEYISATVRKTADLPYRLPASKNLTLVSSYTHAVRIEKEPVLIGERINPTGKPKLKEALRSGELHYVLNEGIRQSDAGVHILDVNVGLPDIDEAAMMRKTVCALQAVTDTPLQLDSSNPAVLESAMRIYNGKPLINSVDGDEKKMAALFPLVKKYGGTLIALTMDQSGIPDTAVARVKIAEKIAARAKEYGIGKNDLIFDPLCLTVSSDIHSPAVTLEAVRMLKSLGYKTSLGVSNISFGLPQREKINSSFFTSALESGLNCAIMNPFSPGMTDAYFSFRALHGFDSACRDYIAYAASSADIPPVISNKEPLSLHKEIVRGLKEGALSAANRLLSLQTPLDIINGQIIPALNEVGKDFEEKRIYLPQLLMSAEAACAAFELLRENMPKEKEDNCKGVILATVKGDIHDIGKNIVKVLLESYGFKVYDLGRDVSPEIICAQVEKTGCRLVGLSALMTTTIPAMEETIALLHRSFSNVKVIVGGAVLTGDYAQKINADHYSPDAMETVRYAKEFYK